jgi:hypothetical protein
MPRHSWKLQKKLGFDIVLAMNLKSSTKFPWASVSIQRPVPQFPVSSSQLSPMKRRQATVQSLITRQTNFIQITDQ